MGVRVVTDHVRPRGEKRASTRAAHAVVAHAEGPACQRVPWRGAWDRIRSSVILCAIPITPDYVLINVPAPINAPPAIEASVPVHETPPLVPLGTLRRRREVTSRGEAGLRIPISEALCVLRGNSGGGGDA